MNRKEVVGEHVLKPAKNIVLALIFLFSLVMAVLGIIGILGI
jgi:hypothetical protein